MKRSPPRLSLCLVVREAAADLRRTLASFDLQHDSLAALPTELVVVDGQSADGSLQMAERWAAQRGFPLTAEQQAPNGIYPAMNTAWRLAAGQWLLFINAGDLLLDMADVSGLLDQADENGIDSLQCRAAIFPTGCRWIVAPLRGAVACHQSLLYRRSLHESLGPYDERLGICADLLLIGRIEQGRHRCAPVLLAATQVSPGNASRNPARVRDDLARLRHWQIPLKPWPSPQRTLLVLEVEARLRFSLTVWIKVVLGLLQGSSRLIRLSDGLL